MVPVIVFSDGYLSNVESQKSLPRRRTQASGVSQITKSSGVSQMTQGLSGVDGNIDYYQWQHLHRPDPEGSR